MKTRKLVYVLMALIFVGGVISVVMAPPTAAQPPDPVKILLQQTDGMARVSMHAETGKVRFIGTDQAHPMPQPGELQAGATAEEAARQFLGVYGSAFGLVDQAQELAVEYSKAVEDGRSVVRFQQVYQGIPVVGGELIVQMNPAQAVLSVNGELLPDLRLDVTPSLDAEAARKTAIAMVANEYEVSAESLTTSSPELWVFNPALLGGPGPRLTSLVWRMDVTPTELLPINELVLVEAHIGAVVLHFNQVDTARDRLTYTANNGTSLPGTLVCNESDPTCSLGDNDAKKAHSYVGATYDFYSDNHGRDSIDNAGMTLISTVHYKSNYDNAFWNGSQMVFGDAYGFANADDVVGHELTHGVTAHESRLFYYYQSGSINESFSDVWGEFVDLTDGMGNDSPGVRWMLGEDITGMGAIRDMSDPTLFYDPDKMSSPYYVCTNSDAGNNDVGGVHHNNGVSNKAAYLMTDGGSFNGQNNITGLGITKVAKIYYEVQTNLMTTAGDYQDLYDDLIQACSNLVGNDGITTADCQQVQKALLAVEMNSQPAACSVPEAPICPTGQTPTNIFFDDLENPTSGNWTSSAITLGVNEWYYPQNANPYAFDATYATSGMYNFWGYGTSVPGDYGMAMNNNVTLPAGTAYMHFKHAYGFEAANSDGGVLEYSANGGPWTDAGSLFSDNGYNGTISSSTNPLNGHDAFVSDSFGYISSRLNLNPLAGKNVKFRFRMGTNNGGWDYGWFIDDIRIYTCATPTTPTPTPTRTVTPPGWAPLPTRDSFLPYLRKDKTPTPSPTPTSLPNTFYSSGDSTVIQGYAGTNYGDYVDMMVGYDKNYFSPAYKAVRSLIQFDLSAIPQGTNISNAMLNVYFVEWLDVPGTSRTIKTYRIGSSWSEMNVTWGNQPSSAESYGSVSITANSQWRYLAIDVTDLVRAWVNGTYPNYGIMLRGTESAIWLRGFYTREGSYKPYLYITYPGTTASVAPPILFENPDAAKGPSFSDLFPSVTDWETCLDQSTPAECFVHR
jgi:bacillolysin